MGSPIKLVCYPASSPRRGKKKSSKRKGKKSRAKKGVMPAGLRKYWAKHRKKKR